jgi:hypothetical protein
LPKKITNPIREGLPSKIYLLSFGRPISGYAIAKKIYGLEKYPPTAKVMEWLKKLVKEGIISKTEEGYFSNIEPLANEIVRTLKEDNDIELSEFERYILEKFLDLFRFQLPRYDLFTRKGYFKGDRDGARELIEEFGSYMMFQQLLSCRDFNIKTKAEFEQKWAIYQNQSELKEKDRVPITDLAPSELRMNLATLCPFFSTFQRIASDGLTHDLFLLWMRQYESERGYPNNL